MSNSFRFTLAVLATWRVTHLLTSEDGPADLIVRFRSLFGQSWAGKLLDCFYCLSVWIAAPAALFVSRNPVEWLFVCLALSGGACLLERITSDTAVIEPMPTTAEGDMYNVLRAETIDANHSDEEPSPDRASSHSRKSGAA